MKAIIITAALALSFTTSQANDCLQNNQSTLIITSKPAAAPEFGRFIVHRLKNDVALDWAVTDPSAVASFKVQRSFDGITFWDLDEVECTSTNPSYKYRDCSGVFGSVYYRVSAELTGGGTVHSETKLVRVVSRG